MPNLPLCHWSSQFFDLRAPLSTDVPVLLLNKPNYSRSVFLVFDCCSQRSHITAPLKFELGLPVGGIDSFGQSNGTLRSCEIVQVRYKNCMWSDSICPGLLCSTSVILVVPSLSNVLSLFSVARNNYVDFPLADRANARNL